jgi:cytochrome b
VLHPLPLLKELVVASSSLLKELHDVIVQGLDLYITVHVAATSSYMRRTA